MSQLINSQIGQQNFELVLDRIGSILRDELGYQETYNEDCECEVYKERDIPFNHGEPTMVNVMMERVDYTMQTQIQHDGDHRYIIEVTRGGKGDGQSKGDTLAMTKCQRLAGVIRAILMNPSYTRLGYEAGFIKNRHIASMEFGKPIRQDSGHIVMARIILSVSFIETTALQTPVTAVGYWTGVRIEETEKGYLYISYN